jgi:hypothetical protein
MVLCKAKNLCFFIFTNFTEGNSARTIAMRLLDSASSRGTLMSHLGCKLFWGSFASSGFASSLLGASHAVEVIILFKIILLFLSSISCGVGTIVITEVRKRLGERESKRFQAEMEEGCHAREMTILHLPRYLDMLVDTVSIRQHFVGYFTRNPP